MSEDIPPAELERLVARQTYLLNAAFNAFSHAAAGEDTLKATSDGILLLEEVMRLGGPEVDPATCCAVYYALQGVLPAVVQAAGPDLIPERIAIALSATNGAFRACCGGASGRESMSLEYATGLGAATDWLRSALEELHHRRRIRAGGDAPFRYAIAMLEFDRAVPNGKPH
jgi:hypothetical protein